MDKTGKRVRRLRRFSEDFKLKLISEFEQGVRSVPELEKFYSVSNATIYRWIYKYSKYNQHGIQVVEVKDSQMQKIKEMETRIKDLERAVGQKQMHIDFLERMINLAKEEYDIDIKKNSHTPPSGSSKRLSRR